VPKGRYVALNGTVTRDKSLAAKFLTYGDAEKFGVSKSISLDGAARYIGHDDFEIEGVSRPPLTTTGSPFYFTQIIRRS
jgi:hypothetical protein